MLERINLLKLKQDLSNLDFSFLDKVCEKMQQNKIDFDSKNSIIFYDYLEQQNIFVDLEKANFVLDYCFITYYFIPKFKDLNIYNELKIHFSDIDLLNKFFNFIFGYSRNYYFTNKKKLISFSNLNKAIQREYPLINKNILKLIKNNFVSFSLEFFSRFCYSSDTFKFTKNRDSESYIRFFKFLDIYDILGKNPRYNDLSVFCVESKKDLCVQLLIMICFINVNFVKNKFDGNIYLNRLYYKDIYKFQNFNKCQHNANF